MKAKTYILIFSIYTIGIVFFASCGKNWKEEIQINEINKGFEELNVPDNFDWRLSKTIQLNIKATQHQSVEVTSTDGSIVYNKGYYHDSDENYTIHFDIPVYENQIKVNDQIIDLKDAYVDVNLSTLKSAQSENQSISFDGTNQYAHINPMPELDEVTEFTFSGWIKHTNTHDAIDFINQINGSKGTFRINVKNDQLYIHLHGNLKAYATWSDYANSISPNTWYQMAIVYDGHYKKNEDKLKLFINGVNVQLIFSGNIPAITPRFGMAPINISEAGRLEGNLDEWRIWDYARTQTQLQDDMYHSLTGTESGLLAYYLMDEIIGNTTPDNSGNGNILYLENSPSLDTNVPFTYIADEDSDGVPDDEDDFPADPARAFKNFSPAAGYGSIVFEDLWPGKGDYDFNDVVIDYQFQINTNADNYVTEIYATFVSKASGAYLQNGFGFELSEAAPVKYLQGKIEVTGMDLQESYIDLRSSGVENNQDKLTFIVFDNIFNRLQKNGSGVGVNTEVNQAFVPYDTIQLEIVPNSNFTAENFAIYSFNPFIIVDLQRGHEVHLLGYAPTSLMDYDLFSTYEDASSPINGDYYKTINNLPWSLMVPSGFNWPKEKVNITSCYYHFVEWAESGGQLFPDWYLDNPGYQNKNLLYLDQ